MSQWEDIVQLLALLVRIDAYLPAIPAMAKDFGVAISNIEITIVFIYSFLLLGSLLEEYYPIEWEEKIQLCWVFLAFVFLLLYYF